MGKNIRKIVGTIFNKYGNQQDFYDRVVATWNYKKLLIGETEQAPQTGEEHYHFYIEFNNSKDFDAVVNKLNPFKPHIESLRTNELAIWEYCTKEGLFFANYNIEDIITKEVWKAKIESAVIEDIIENKMPIKELIKKYPKYALYNHKAIIWIYQLIGEKAE